MSGPKRTISPYVSSATSRDTSEAWSSAVTVGAEDQEIVVILRGSFLRPVHFFVFSDTPGQPPIHIPPISYPTPSSSPPPPSSQYSSLSYSPLELPLLRASLKPPVPSPVVDKKRPKKVHFALPEHNRSPSPDITSREPEHIRARKVQRQVEPRHACTTPKRTRTVSDRGLKEALGPGLPQQPSTSLTSGTRPTLAQPSTLFHSGKAKLPQSNLGQRLYKALSPTPKHEHEPVQPSTMAPPPLPPYEVESPDECLPPPRTGYYSGPWVMGEMYVYEPRGVSVPTRGYAQPVPILRSPSPSRSESAVGDFEEEIKITHTEESPAIGASHQSSRHGSSHHGHAYEVYHFCSICRRPRSRKFHHLNPVKPGQRIDPGVCRKCEAEDDSSDEKVIIDRPGRKPPAGVFETESVKVYPIEEERERGRAHHNHRDNHRASSESRVYINVKESEGRRGRRRSRSDSRVQITIEETIPARRRRSKSRTLVRVSEKDRRGRRGRRRSTSSSRHNPLKQPMTVRYVTDAEKKLKSHPQAFRHGIFTKSKPKEREHARAPSPPSAGMTKLSIDPATHPKSRTEASHRSSRARRDSQAARTHTSWVTYPASSPPESPRANHDTRSMSTLRSGMRPSRPATSPRRHMQARHSSHRAEDMGYYDETSVRFTPGPTDEQARRCRGYDGHFSEEAQETEGMREYYWYDAPRQWSATPRNAMPSSEPTSYSARGYRRVVDEPEPTFLFLHPRTPLSTGPVRVAHVPSEAVFEPAASRRGGDAMTSSSHAPGGAAPRPWTQHSSNVGSSMAGSRSSYHLVDVRDVNDTESAGYPTRIREIEDTRYSRGEMEGVRLRMEEKRARR